MRRGKMRRARVPGEALLVVATALLFCGLAWGEVRYVNGPDYWAWTWRTLPLLRTAALLFFPLLALAYVHHRVESGDNRGRLVWILVPVLLAFQLMAIQADPASFGMIRMLVTSPLVTGFFTDALRISDIGDWIAAFHTIPLEIHSASHPPGPILAYKVLIDSLGEYWASYAGGFLIAALASLGPAVMFQFSRLWTTDPRTRLLACLLYTLTPGVILFFPVGDQVYPILAMYMVLGWVYSLERSLSYAAFFGCVLFVSTMFAYNLLTLGAFFTLYTIYRSCEPHSRIQWRRIGRAAVVAVLVFAGLHLLLHLATGYRPLLAFHQAVRNQEAIDAILRRPYAPALFFNVYDLFLAAGIAPFPLLVLYLKDNARNFAQPPRELTLSCCGLLTIAIVNISGLLSAETARLWLFLQPFVVMPVALKLARMNRREVTCVLLAQWLVLVVLKAKMWFLHP
jgi:hypothetical protein